jgi:hypothetical protein
VRRSGRIHKQKTTRATKHKLCTNVKWHNTAL